MPILIGFFIVAVAILGIVVKFTGYLRANETPRSLRRPEMAMFMHPALLDTPEARYLTGETDSLPVHPTPLATQENDPNNIG